MDNISIYCKKSVQGTDPCVTLSHVLRYIDINLVNKNLEDFNKKIDDTIDSIGVSSLQDIDNILLLTEKHISFIYFKNSRIEVLANKLSKFDKMIFAYSFDFNHAPAIKNTFINLLIEEIYKGEYNAQLSDYILKDRCVIFHTKALQLIQDNYPNFFTREQKNTISLELLRYYDNNKNTQSNLDFIDQPALEHIIEYADKKIIQKILSLNIKSCKKFKGISEKSIVTLAQQVRRKSYNNRHEYNLQCILEINQEYLCSYSLNTIFEIKQTLPYISSFSNKVKTILIPLYEICTLQKSLVDFSNSKRVHKI